MNKLVSKNSIQRFKQGRKIVKAQGGIKTSRRTPGGQIIYDNNSSEPGFFSRFWSYLTSPQQPRVGMNGKPIVDTMQENPNSTPKSKGYSFMKGETRQRTPEEQKNWEAEVQRQKNLMKDDPRKVINKRIITPRFLSKYSNMENTIGGANNIKAWQQKLKNYYAPGTYNPDSVWGANTQAAYDRYLADQAKQSVKFTVPSITEPTQNELSELDKRAKPITVNPTTTQQNEFAQDKQTSYPSMSRSTAQELFDKIILRDEFKTPYNPNFNWKNAPKLSYYPKLNYYYAKKGVKLIPKSKNSIERFKQGKRILFAQGGTGNLKRFKYASSDGKIVKEFDTKEEAEAYRKKIGKPGVIRDYKGASNGTVVKTNRANEKATAYDRQEIEKPYNNLSLKEAYKKAQSSGNQFFGYKGKVYRTDLKNGKDNITDMIKIYGNNLGWDKDPKLQNKSSRTAREEYRKRVKSTNNSRPVKPLETNSSANSKADAYEKATWNGGKGFTDLMMPNNVIMKLGERAADGLFGTNYSNNKIYRFGLNPFGISEDASEGNLGGLALRGLDAYTWLGMPGASQFVDRQLTAHAPKLLEVANTSKYVPKGGLENGTLNKWNWNSLAKWGSPATRDSYRRGIRATVTEGGRRSMQRAANEGVEIGGFKGFDKARQWATNFGQNTNTGTTFFFRGAPTGYDIAADRAVQLTPYIAAPVDVTTQFLNTHPME